MNDSDTKPYQGRGRVHEGADHNAPYPVSRLSPGFELVDLAREIAAADQVLEVRTSSKLRVIADQIRALQTEARAILEETRRDQELFRARCNFKRIPGRTYHLYRHDDGSLHFSMLSPEDWNGKPPHVYEGSYRLENDMSWTPAEEADRPDDSRALVKRLLDHEGL
jgi:hypothetical protein